MGQIYDEGGCVSRLMSPQDMGMGVRAKNKRRDKISCGAAGGLI